MILTEEQKEKIDAAHKAWLESVGCSLAEEVKRRNQVSKEMHDLLEEVRLFKGRAFNAEQLCPSVEIQKKVHT